MKTLLPKVEFTEVFELEIQDKASGIFPKMLLILAIAVFVFILTSGTSVEASRDHQEFSGYVIESTAPPVPF
ncbi:hypothetical protein [Christiangramia aquimixticola]|uniref:hypothetical protein n=1 Tax=Christiangramia aquimixticola TaxID=1697558 RepID=UPI003AA919A3